MYQMLQELIQSAELGVDDAEVDYHECAELDGSLEQSLCTLWDMTVDENVCRHVMKVPNFIQLCVQLIESSQKRRLVVSAQRPHQ